MNINVRILLILLLSTLLQFDTSVVSCEPVELKLENNGKKEKVKGFNVKLKDTILFPEGGGQVSVMQLNTMFTQVMLVFIFFVFSFTASLMISG